MKIEDLKRAINGVLGENHKKRTEAVVSLDKSYVSWRTFYWTDEAWEAYIASLEKNREIEIETNGDVVIVFKRSRREKSSE